MVNAYTRAYMAARALEAVGGCLPVSSSARQVCACSEGPVRCVHVTNWGSAMLYIGCYTVLMAQWLCRLSCGMRTSVQCVLACRQLALCSVLPCVSSFDDPWDPGSSSTLFTEACAISRWLDISACLHSPTGTFTAHRHKLCAVIVVYSSRRGWASCAFPVRDVPAIATCMPQARALEIPAFIDQAQTVPAISAQQL